MNPWSPWGKRFDLDSPRPTGWAEFPVHHPQINLLLHHRNEVRFVAVPIRISRVRKCQGISKEIARRYIE